MHRKPSLRVVLMGRFEASVGGRAVASSAWRLSKAKDLIKVLALSPGRRLQRDQLLEILWPGRDPASALNNFHQVLHAARRAIGSAGADGHACLTLKDETVSLCPDGGIEVDVDEFESAAHDALASGRRGDIEAALDLYPGDLLPDDRYADWAHARREILQRLRSALMFELAARLEEAGQLAGAADVLGRLVLEDPTDERSQRALMRVSGLAGDRTAAIRRYEALEQVLRDELGVAPDPASRRMFEAVVSGEIGPPQDEGSDSRPPTNLRPPLSSFVGRTQELAELAVLTRANRLVTLVGAGGCGKTRLAQEVARRGLQRFSGGTYFVELAHLDQARDVAQETMRTLEVRRGPDETAAQAVGRWIGKRSVLLILDNCEHVADEAALLIGALLDACPRLKVLATSREPIRVPGEVVRRVSSLRAPDPRRLPSPSDLRDYDAVTLFAERARNVQRGFELDDRNAADVALVCFRLDGMPLALELAAARVPALGVSGVARNLDDRFRILTEGPRTAPSRQRTLEATVDWSFGLLTEDERDLFLGLSVFNGSFDLDAARAIANDNLREQAAALVGRLVEQSMVVAYDAEGTVRYRLLETLRAYGLDRLRAAGQLDGARDRHAVWLRLLIGSTKQHASASRRSILVLRLGRAHDDLAPAVNHLLATDARSAARLAAQLWPYWLWRSHLGEGLSVIEHVLEHSGPSSERADLLIGASALGFRWKGFAEMERYAVMSRHEAAALGDVDGLCRALIFSAAAPFNRDDFDTAHTLFREALELARTHHRPTMEISARLCLAMLAASRLDFTEAGGHLDWAETLATDSDPDTVVLDLYTLGAWMPTRRRGERLYMHSETFMPFEDGMGRPARASVALARGNLERLAGRFDRSAPLLETALHVSERVGDRAGEALALSWMGQLAFDRGDFDAAERYLKSSLRIRRRIVHLRGVVTSLISLARLATERAQFEIALSHVGEAEDVCRRRLDRVGTAQVLAQRAQVEMACGNPGAAVAGLSDAVVLWRTLGYGIAVACALRDLGEAQVVSGRSEHARATLAEATETFDRNGYVDEARRCKRLGFAAVG
jgi:predicted ATPase/DNA-binding SARP family transcriptional activator